VTCDALTGLLPVDVSGPDDTVAAGRAIGRLLKPGDVLTMRGDLGAGKTTLVRGIVAGLGGNPDVVTSPTFAIVQTYSTAGAPVHHVDAFRIESVDELDEFGFDEYFGGDAIVLVEWPERVAERLPADTCDLELEHREVGRRISAVRAPDPVR